MPLTEVLGALGLSLIVGAFVATLAGRLSTTEPTYLALNAVGAGILAWYSARINIWIFIVLESVWSLAALWSLIRYLIVKPGKLSQLETAKSQRGENPHEPGA